MKSIQIDQSVTALKTVPPNILRTCQPPFLISRKDQAQRSVGEIRRHQKHCRSQANAAVCSQGTSSICAEPAILHLDCHRILQGAVVCCAHADHIRMGLKDKPAFSLPTRRRRNVTDDVIIHIPLWPQPQPRQSVHQICAHRLLVARRPGNGT